MTLFYTGERTGSNGLRLPMFGQRHVKNFRSLLGVGRCKRYNSGIMATRFVHSHKLHESPDGGLE